MSKAAELASKYCEGSSFVDACVERPAYIAGYYQAEKDLELTWEDISIIRQIMFDYNRTIRNGMSIPNNKEYCEEVLKRFKEGKETKD